MENKLRNYRTLEYVASACTMIGVSLISLKHPALGQLITGLGNFLFTAYGFLTGQKALGLSAFFLFLIEVLGVINWLR